MHFLFFLSIYSIFVLVLGYPSGKMEDHEEMSNITRGKHKYKYSFDIQAQDYGHAGQDDTVMIQDFFFFPKCL